MVKIAYLVLAHRDSEHIQRLVKRASRTGDIFLHIDAKSDVDIYSFEDMPDNVKVMETRFRTEWGGFCAVAATVEMMRSAMRQKQYDRLILLQGADYPIKSDKEILDFFEKNKEIEYIRGCCCSGQKDAYFAEKCRYYLFYNNRNIIKKCWNKASRILKLKLKNGYIRDKDQKYPVYWGSAQWALSGKCASYLIQFYDEHPEFNRWFLSAFPADELYFTTVVMNSSYKSRTTAGGPEPARRGVENWRNLHYFIYEPGRIKVFSMKDREAIQGMKELFIRKVDTEQSTSLLDWLDEQNERNV